MEEGKKQKPTTAVKYGVIACPFQGTSKSKIKEEGSTRDG